MAELKSALVSAKVRIMRHTVAVVLICFGCAMAAMAQPFGYRPPENGTILRWKVDDRDVESRVYAGSGRTIIWETAQAKVPYYGGFWRMDPASPPKFNEATLNALWPLEVGKSIYLNVTYSSPYGDYDTSIHFSIPRAETVSVAAGSFDALVIDIEERTVGNIYYPFSRATTVWFAPSLGFLVKSDFKALTGQAAGRRIRFELQQIGQPTK